MAKGFQFPYRTILEVKEKQERSLEMELGRMDRTILEKRSALRRAEEQRDDLLRRIGEARRRGDMAENRRCADYLEHVRGTVHGRRRQLQEAEARREGVRKELERVMQSRKVLEKYRERLRAEFLARREKAEERIHELYSAREFSQTKDRA